MKQKVGVTTHKFITGLIIATLAFCAASAAVCPLASAATGWSKTYGGTGADIGTGYTFQTSDGGYAIEGDTSSFGAGGSDFWLIKTDAAGNMQWNKTYGGPLNEVSGDMCQTGDGGYAIAGGTYSFGAGGEDVWLVKTDASGTASWNMTYGGTGTEVVYHVAQTSDGGYAMAGSTTSFGAGGMDVWVIKTDVSGNLLWNRTYGGSGADWANCIIQTADGGYAIAGVTSSFGAGGQDDWLVKTDAAGTMQWNKTYGGTGIDWAEDFLQSYDGGYTLVGFTTSFGAGSQDAWLIKTDTGGNMQWNKTYGTTAFEIGLHVLQTADGYAMVGWNGVNGQDFLLIKTDTAGTLLWNMTYGGPGIENGYALLQSSDGGYVLTGTTNSFGAGGNDIWLVKTDASGVLPYKAPPAASAFNSVSVLPGWTWYFFVHSNGGVGAHKYQWYDASGLLAGQTSMVLPVTKTVPGTYTFFCKVTDSEGTSANSNNVTLTVMG